MTVQPMQERRDTAANWTAANPVPLLAQWCYESDTSRWKVGDGITSWNALEYFGAEGSGTVTSVAVESANGFAGTVADSTSTPQIMLETTVTGLLKGNGTAVSAAAAGTDYLAPGGSGAELTGITVGQVSGAAPLASPVLTGTPAAPTASALTDSTQVATTAYTDSAVAVETSRAETAEALKAPLASPALTGTPTAPTASGATNTTQVATTAYVYAAANAAQSAAEEASVPIDGGTMTGALNPKVVTLTQSEGNVAIDMALGNVFRLVLTASGWTLSNPTGYEDGQPIRVRLIQDGTGVRTISYGSAWDFGAAGAPTLSTGASKVDYLAGEWSADANDGAGAVVISSALGY